jgi:hypothetical protein
LVEHFAILAGGRLFAALDGQRVLFRFDRKLVLAEAGNRDSNAVVILAGAFDVVRRIARSGIDAVHQRKQPVETDGGAIKGGEIECTHQQVLQS